MIAKSKSAYGGVRTRWVHIGHCTSITDMFLQQEIRLTISRASTYTMRIVSKVHCSIFNSLKIFGIVMQAIKHSILPSSSRTSTERSWRFRCLELWSIMSILDEKFHMSICMHVNNNWRIVYYVMIKILKFWFFKSQFLNSSL